MNCTIHARVVVALAGGATALSLSMGGCSRGVNHLAGPTRAPSATGAPAAWTYTGRPVTEMIAAVPIPPGAGTDDAALGARLVSEQVITMDDAGMGKGEGLSPGAVTKQPGELLKVKYAANNAPATEVLHVLLGQLLNRPYIVDPKVTNTVSLDVDEEMTRAELLDFLGALCSMYDWAIEDRDGVMMVRQAGGRSKMVTAPMLTGQAANESEMPAVRIRKLKYASPDSVVTVLKELMSEGAKQLVTGRMIVMADTVRQVNRMSRLISALDTSTFEGVNVWTYRLSTRTPDDAANILDKILLGSKANPAAADPLATFVPVTGSDRLIVLSRDASLRPLIKTFVEQVDQPPDKSRRQRYLYRVQNMEPSALLAFVSAAMPDKIESAGGSGPGAPPGSAAGVGAGKRPVRMVLEQSERLFLIEAAPADYADVLSFLKSVDRPKMQVVINSTIAEVALTGSLEFGVQYFFQGDAVKKLGIIGLTGSPGLPVGSPTGSVFLTASDGIALVQALQRESKVEILSQPQVFARDGIKATINVGGQTPVAKSSAETPAQTSGTTLSRTDIDYKDTGVKLEIEPKINESGIVRLKITQENRVIAAPDTSTQAGTISPNFQTRTVTTEVEVPNGRTVVLGGFIDHRKEKRVAKVPILGSLPLIGEVFTATFDKTDKTELLLTITPTIIPEPSETVTVMSDFLRAADNVRSVFNDNLRDLPRGMLHDPEYGLTEPSVPKAATIPELGSPAAPPAPAPQ